MMAQPRVDVGANYGNRDFGGDATRPDVVGQTRQSTYPYQTTGSVPSVDPVAAGFGQNRLAQPGAYNADFDPARTTVKMPLTSYPQNSTAVTGNPDDLYAKVVKNRNGSNDRQAPVQGYADGNYAGQPGNMPGRYDRQASGYAVDPRQNVEYPQDPRFSGRKADGEPTNRDYNFNVPNKGYNWRETGQRPDGERRDPVSGDFRYAQADADPPGSYRPREQRSFNRGERHLDGTPMFGDVRKGARSPANVPGVARDSFRGDVLLASTPNLAQDRAPPQQQQQRGREDNFFQYPLTASNSQVCRYTFSMGAFVWETCVGNGH
jgi:hypothetical protein